MCRGESRRKREIMSEYEQYDEVESGESLLAVLDEITVMVENAKSVPLSSSILLNRHELLELLNNAAQMLPSELVEAHNMLQERAKVSDQARDTADRIIAESREQAKHILAQAKAQAQRMVSRDSVTVKARQQAAQIVDEAKSKAARISAGADQYSDSMLAEVASQLGAVQEYIEQIQVQIDAGRDVLAQRQEAEAELVAERDAADREEELHQQEDHRRVRELARENTNQHHQLEAEDEFSDTELDFAAVQAAYARAEEEDAIARSEVRQTEQAAQGGEVPVAMQVPTDESELPSTAQTAAVAAEHDCDLPAQAEKDAGNENQLLSQLPADFDEFVPELEFDEYNEDYRA